MFALAHLSDIHLAPLPAPGIRALTGKRLTGFLNWQRKRRFVHDRGVLNGLMADMTAQAPDHIACTGDIVNIGLPAEYPPGRLFLESLGSPQDVSLVPGNHDIYVADSEAQAQRAWGDYMRGDADETFPYVRRRGPIAIVGLSSGVPTPPFNATGKLGDAQLLQFAEALEQTRNDNLFRVVMIHHPPVSASPHHKRLTDADALMTVIAAHGAELLLHGHDHLDMLNWLDGPNGTRVPAIGVPSASTAPGKDTCAAAYHLYRIDGQAGAWTCEMIAREMGADGVVQEVKGEKLA